MSVDFVPENLQHYYSEIYHAEWKLTNVLSYKKKKLVSPPFSPLAKLDVKFCFELWFLDYSGSSGIPMALIKIVLIKLDGSTLPESLKLRIEINVEYSDGQLLKQFIGLPVVAVNELENYYFEEITVSLGYKNQNSFEFGRRMYANKPLLLKCRMTFFDHLAESESPTNCLPSPVSLPLKTLEISNNDVKSFKKSDESSDIIIRGGSRLFFAHKAVLSNHSSVFKQKISQQAEDETILVIDESADAIDSFLDYLYSDELELTSWPKLRDLYVLSAKYEVDTLKKKCATAILSHLSVDKVGEILKVACDFEDSNLKEAAIQFASEHFRDIVSSKEWKEFIVSHSLVANEIVMKALNI